MQSTYQQYHSREHAIVEQAIVGANYAYRINMIKEFRACLVNAIIKC